MQPPFREINLNVRSGLVSGLLEAIAILIFAPLITRATTQVYNALTTRRVLQGTPVKIRDNSLSVEDIIPRVIHVIRTASTRNPQVSSHVETPFADVTRQLVPLFISVVMSVAIVLTSTFIDGTSAPVYTSDNVFLWNGGMFVDTTSTGVNTTADEIFGMEGVRRACIERVERVGPVDPNSVAFNLYAVAFSEPQNFDTGLVANDSVCVNGRDTKQTIGVTIETDLFPSVLEAINMTDATANLTFGEYLEYPKYSKDYCRARLSVNGSSTDWTFSSQQHNMRFATRATVDANGVITMRAGQTYRSPNGEGTRSDNVPETDCNNLYIDSFIPERFAATIKPIGIQQDLRQLEIVVLDMLRPMSINVRIDPQDVMIRSYYAGASISDGDSEQSLGTFVPRQIEITTPGGTKQITTISGVAMVGFVSTIVGCFISFLVLIFVRPTVRVTSVSYISRLYSRRDAEKQDSDVMSGEVEYIGTEKSYDGSVYARPVQVNRNYVL